MSERNATKCYLLRIDLLHAHQPTWREVVVPSDISLDLLHDVIQVAMGWEEAHPHEFEFKGVRYQSMFFGGEHLEEMVALDQLLKRARQKLNYMYDFGDGWAHSITLKKALPWNEAEVYVCTDGAGACPLEDCGGVYGHEQICNYVRDPKSADGGFMDYEEWVPEDYDPDRYDRDAVNEDLADLKLEHSGEGDEELFDEIVAEMEESGQFDGTLGELNAWLEEGEMDEDVAAPEPYAHLLEEELSAFRRAFIEGAKVRESEPWKCLWDQDIFGVRDPESGLLDFVSILGRGGEVYAVHVHRPPEAYDFWCAAKAGTQDMDSMAAYLRQIRMVELEFVNKAEMEPEDLELYERLEYPAPKRGSRRWMRVRRYHPRGMPWYAPPELMPALTRGAALACRFVEVIRSEPDRSRSAYLEQGPAAAGVPASLPVFTLPSGGRSKDWKAWELQVEAVNWAEAGGARLEYAPVEFELERVAALPVVDETWEVGAVYAEEAVMAEEGPVIPIVAMAAPTVKEGPAPEPYISSRLEEGPGDCVWKAFMQTAIGRGERPATLLVTTDTAFNTFDPLSRLAGLRLERVDGFVHLDGFFAMLQDGMF